MFPSVKPEAVGWKWGLIIPPGPMNITFLYIHSTKSREVCEDIKIFNYRLLSLGNHSHGVRIHTIRWFYLLEQIHPLKVTTPSTDPSEKGVTLMRSRYFLCRVIRDLGRRCPGLQQIVQIKKSVFGILYFASHLSSGGVKTIHLSSSNQRTSVIITQYVCGRGFWQGCEQPAKDSKLH